MYLKIWPLKEHKTQNISFIWKLELLRIIVIGLTFLLILGIQ